MTEHTPNPDAATLTEVSAQLQKLRSQLQTVADRWHHDVPGHHHFDLMEASKAIETAARDLATLAETDVSIEAARRAYSSYDADGDNA